MVGIVDRNAAEAQRAGSYRRSATHNYSMVTGLHAMRSLLDIVTMAVTAVAIVGSYGWDELRQPGIPARCASANGRIEAAGIDITTKYAGRMEQMLVREERSGRNAGLCPVRHSGGSRTPGRGTGVRVAACGLARRNELL